MSGEDRPSSLGKKGKVLARYPTAPAGRRLKEDFSLA
jgi:hypothetical protein